MWLAERLAGPRLSRIGGTGVRPGWRTALPHDWLGAGGSLLARPPRSATAAAGPSPAASRQAACRGAAPHASTGVAAPLRPAGAPRPARREFPPATPCILAPSARSSNCHGERLTMSDPSGARLRCLRGLLGCLGHGRKVYGHATVTMVSASVPFRSALRAFQGGQGGRCRAAPFLRPNPSLAGRCWSDARARSGAGVCATSRPPMRLRRAPEGAPSRSGPERSQSESVPRRHRRARSVTVSAPAGGMGNLGLLATPVGVTPHSKAKPARYFGRLWSDSGRHVAKLGRTRPDFAPMFCRTRHTQLVEFGPRFGRIWAHIWSKLARPWPNVVKICQLW